MLQQIALPFGRWVARRSLAYQKVSRILEGKRSHIDEAFACQPVESSVVRPVAAKAQRTVSQSRDQADTWMCRQRVHFGIEMVNLYRYGGSSRHAADSCSA